MKKGAIMQVSIYQIEEDRSVVALQVEKIKNGTAKFFSLEEINEKLDDVLSAYEN